ncbi:MAG: hypothetical protein KBS55_04930 [Bacteroidales bacterium]|nr:hypothetical protein [Candidatus Cryptobacteroides aphodequi]
MDIVITYVNGLDPLWQQDYAAAVGGTALTKRFRDWGTLRYLLRGIEKNMPFVGNVFLLVSRESQVPEWVDRSKVRIVLHSDIIPEEYLPVFNASAIEMFIHRIPGLGEEYLYFNDDVFPVLPCKEEDFFEGGKPNIGMRRQLLVLRNPFRALVRHDDRFARKMAASPCRSLFYVRPQHTVTPMLRSQCEELYGKATDAILASVTPLRRNGNFNQYLFTDYVYYKGLTNHKRISNKHFSLAVSNASKVCEFLKNPDCALVCINDVQMPQEKFESLQRELLSAFESILPEFSRFELQK